MKFLNLNEGYTPYKLEVDATMYQLYEILSSTSSTKDQIETAYRQFLQNTSASDGQLRYGTYMVTGTPHDPDFYLAFSAATAPTSTTSNRDMDAENRTKLFNMINFFLHTWTRYFKYDGTQTNDSSLAAYVIKIFPNFALPALTTRTTIKAIRPAGIGSSGTKFKPYEGLIEVNNTNTFAIGWSDTSGVVTLGESAEVLVNLSVEPSLSYAAEIAADAANKLKLEVSKRYVSR